MPPRRQPFFRKRHPGRQVDPRHLEQRDRVVAQVRVVAGRGHEALGEGRPQDRMVGGERHGESQRVWARVARDEAPCVGLAEAAAAMTSSATAAGADPA